jgi:hypothetical protein
MNAPAGAVVQMDDHSSPVKAGLAWVGVGLAKLGIHTWSDIAAVAATIYTALLIIEWCHKRWKKK